MNRFLIYCTFLCFMPSSGGAQILNPVKWKFEQVKINAHEYELVYIARADKGWTVYSQFTSDDGPVPTSINYESMAGIELVGKASESGAKKEGIDSYFGVNVIKFTSEKPFVIRQKIKVKDASLPVKGYVNFMACDHEKCLPPSDVDFTFNFGENISSPIHQKVDQGTPGGISSLSGQNDSTTIKSVTSTSPADVSPIGDLRSVAGPVITGDRINQKISSLSETYQNPLSTCGGTEEKKEGLLWTVIFGFIGGILALLTPCVFPMLPITISFFTKDSKRKGWVNGLIYGASIIVIYLVIGLLITIFIGPEALNRLSTNWIAQFIVFYHIYCICFFFLWVL